MAAGLSPVAFWDETPRSFVSIMEGASRAAQRRFDANLSLAWHTAAFGGAAQNGKLKSLDHYAQKRDQRQTPKEMLGALRMLQDMGAPMDIRQIN